MTIELIAAVCGVLLAMMDANARISAAALGTRISVLKQRITTLEAKPEPDK